MSRVTERIKEAARSMPLDKMTAQAFNKDMKASKEKDPSKKNKLENQARSIRATMDMDSLKKKKKKTTKESFSDWRNDLREVVDIPSSEPKTDEKARKTVTGKGVNNKVVINPPMKEAFEEIGGIILEVAEVDEAYYEEGKKKEKWPSIKDKDAPHKKIVKRPNKKYSDSPHGDFYAPSIKKEENLEEKLCKADIEKMQDDKDKKDLKKAGKVKEEVENIDERTRYAKKTGKDFTTGKPSEKGGTRSGDSAYDMVRANMKKTGGLMSDRGKAIQPQGKKKEKGKKGYKGVTPVDKIKAKLSKKRAPKPSIGSRFD